MIQALNIKVSPINKSSDPFMLNEESVHLAAYYYSINLYNLL